MGHLEIREGGVEVSRTVEVRITDRLYIANPDVIDVEVSYSHSELIDQSLLMDR